MSKFFFSFPSNEIALGAADGVFGALIDRLEVSKTEKHRLLVIVSELFNNAYLHGNKGDPAKYIDVVLELGAGEFTASVRDQGPGIDAARLSEAVPSDPDFESEHGRGLKIMRKFGDKVDMSTDRDGRFCVKVTRKIGGTTKIAAAAAKG